MPSESDLDSVTPYENPGLESTVDVDGSEDFASKPDRSSPGGPGGPPEDDDDDDRRRDIPKPNRTPPSERPRVGIPERDSPPPDSGEEGRRVDDVTPSPNPGIDSPTQRAPPAGF